MASQNAVPTGTVTFLFTDIEGSTDLAQRYPDQMAGLLARHHALIREAAQAFHGYTFQVVGDAFCIAFDSANAAVNASIKAQRLLHEEAWAPAPVKVRMGIHTGKADFDPNGEYHGYLTLSLVQRLMSAAHGGQVLLSLATQELIRNELPEGATLRDMGERRLKDVVRLEHVYQLVIPNLPADFPPIRTLDARRDNLPAQITSFIGREKELHEIKEAIQHHRLVTLTGAGGAGKTRLGLEVAAACLERFPDGVWLAELASAENAALVSQTLLSIFDLREDNNRSALEIMVERLREKSLLIVLDNCEHLIDACARVADALLQACPRLSILATSREALGIVGEIAYRVPSMSTPNPERTASLDELKQVDAIQLFLQRAAAAMPGFQLTGDNARFIAQICSRLDGIPLAIELAASRIRSLSSEQIASRLDDRFRLLTGGSRTALPRQQTLRAAIDWSYSLLSDPEKRLFRRLAVFAGGWTLQAAEAVCGEQAGSPDVIDLLTRLVDKSLVFVEQSADENRYHRLETIRQYSRERLSETDEAQSLKDRHLDFFVQFSELVDEKLKGAEQNLWHRRMSAELDNLRAALDWGLMRDPDKALRIAGAANLFWTAGGFSAEGFRWTQEALQKVESLPALDGASGAQRLLARAKALRGLTRLFLSLGDNASARRAAEQSVALYRQTGDRRGLAFALVVLAYPLEFLGERAQAETALQESYSISREEGDTYTICRSLNRLARVIVDLYRDFSLSKGYIEESIRLAREAGLRSQEAQGMEILGWIAAHQNDYDEARMEYQQALEVYARIGATFNVTLQKSNLAHLERQLEHYDKALEYYRETIVSFRDIGQAGAVAHQLECFGFISLAQGSYEHTAQLFAASEAMRERTGTPMTPDEHVYYDTQLHTLHQHLDSMQYAQLWSQARSLTLEQAIELAVD